MNRRQALHRPVTLSQFWNRSRPLHTISSSRLSAVSPKFRSSGHLGAEAEIALQAPRWGRTRRRAKVKALESPRVLRGRVKSCQRFCVRLRRRAAGQRAYARAHLDGTPLSIAGHSSSVLGCSASLQDPRELLWRCARAGSDRPSFSKSYVKAPCQGPPMYARRFKPPATNGATTLNEIGACSARIPGEASARAWRVMRVCSCGLRYSSFIKLAPFGLPQPVTASKPAAAS
jgi:hypothetical protein